jgi:hypothetical protein
MAKRRERPIARVNPSGERVWRARATDFTGKQHYRGAFRLKREAQDAIDAACEEWEAGPPSRDTVGQYAAGWTEKTSPLGSDRLRPRQQAPAGPRCRDRRSQAPRLAVCGASPQPCKALSRRLGVSDNALRNRLRAYEAGRQPGEGARSGGGKLWRYDNWMRDVWNPTVKRTGMAATPKDFARAGRPT